MVLSFSFLLPPSLALGAGTSKTLSIGYIETLADGVVGVKSDGKFWNNPDGCDSHRLIVLGSSTPAYSELYTALMAAFMRGHQIQAQLDGCTSFDGATYPTIAGVRVLPPPAP